MYSLHLTCKPSEVDLLSGELWQAGTVGIRECDSGSGQVELMAGFEVESPPRDLLRDFAPHLPRWEREEEKDWVGATQAAWPGRFVGSRLFLAAPWCSDPTPEGRLRVIHNPGLASGTGEHPCTQLALKGLETAITPGCVLADIGTGSGILAIASLRLGAAVAIAIDPDESALSSAKENFELNGLPPNLIAGSADGIETCSMDVVVANINGSVLLTIADDLLRIVRPDGKLILTGFPEAEWHVLEQVFPSETVFTQDGWKCVISRISWAA